MDQAAYMTPEELKAIRMKFGATLKEMSELLSTPYRTYQDWEHGNRRIPGVCQEAVNCFLKRKGGVKRRLKKLRRKGGKKIMGRERTLFKTEEPKSTQETASFLRTLADKIESGNLLLKGNGQEVQLNIPANITLETKVEEEKKKRGMKMSLEVEIEWYLGEGANPTGVSIE